MTQTTTSPATAQPSEIDLLADALVTPPATDTPPVEPPAEPTTPTEPPAEELPPEGGEPTPTAADGAPAEPPAQPAFDKERQRVEQELANTRKASAQREQELLIEKARLEGELAARKDVPAAPPGPAPETAAQITAKIQERRGQIKILDELTPSDEEAAANQRIRDELADLNTDLALANGREWAERTARLEQAVIAQAQVVAAQANNVALNEIIAGALPLTGGTDEASRVLLRNQMAEVLQKAGITTPEQLRRIDGPMCKIIAENAALKIAAKRAARGRAAPAKPVAGTHAVPGRSANPTPGQPATPWSANPDEENERALQISAKELNTRL